MSRYSLLALARRLYLDGGLILKDEIKTKKKMK